jgi:hypothetical protein
MGLHLREAATSSIHDVLNVCGEMRPPVDIAVSPWSEKGEGRKKNT